MDSYRIQSLTDLEAIYGKPALASTVKVSNHITPAYRALIEASPFCAIATAGPEGLDCSPRGDHGQCLSIEDSHTLLMPDRRGNNRIDSLRNIVRDSRIALMLLIPGSGTSLRINGTADLTVEPGLLERFSVNGQRPRCIIRVSVTEIYFQCARAIIRAGLWNQENHVDTDTLFTPGQILDEMSEGEVDGPTYDRDWPNRASKTMW